MLAVVIRDRRTTEVRRARVFIPRLTVFRVLLLRVGFIISHTLSPEMLPELATELAGDFAAVATR